MVRYEIKKVLGTAGGKIALLTMAAVVLVTFFFAGPRGVYWVNEQGEHEYGFHAVKELRTATKAWAGPLDEEKLQAVILENQRIIATPEAQSQDYHQNDIAYGWKQGFRGIRYLLNYAFRESLRPYNYSTYYIADSLTSGQAKDFYPNRIQLLKDWLNDPTGSGYDRFTDGEKALLISRYEALETPLSYDYAVGWDQIMAYSTTITMLCAMILGHLLAGIFSNEFRWHSDSIFFSCFHGRKQAVQAKIKAGFLLTTLVYWASMLSFSLLTLLYLGFDGWSCPIQSLWKNWECFYNITIGQCYLLIALGGYLGNLFIAFLVMWVSAKSKSSLLAVTIPYMVIFLPTFLQDFEDTKFLGTFLTLFPERLLSIGFNASDFGLISFGKHVVGTLPVCFLLYFIWSLLLVPAMYRSYRNKQIT